MKKWMILLITAVSFVLFARPFIPAGDLSEKVLAGVQKDEYMRIMAEFGPRDRLYCQDDTCWFIVSRMEAHQWMERGFEVTDIRPLPDRVDHTAAEYPDINGTYHNYEETLAELEDLALRYPDQTDLISIGTSVEGRELMMLKISDHAEEQEEEPDIFIIGCHHAREWISVEIPLLFARWLLENMATDPRASDAVNGAQVYILPLMNPDGLEFSIKTYRYWRKNRVYNGDMSWGVDLNRNYSYMWGMDDTGSSPDPASEIYRGPSPFSEPESVAVRDYISRIGPEGVLSYHNYSQLILLPWGYTNDPPEDLEELTAMGNRMSDLIYEVNGRRYTAGAGSLNLYNTNGGLVDWVYGTFRVPAFTIELPPEFAYEGGFYTSHEEITRTFAENLPAMLWFTNQLIDHPFQPEGR